MGWTRRGEGFDRETGVDVVIYVWTCPNWTSTASSGHDRYERTVGVVTRPK